MGLAMVEGSFLDVIKLSNPAMYQAIMEHSPPVNYNDFIGRLYDHLDRIIITLQENPQTYGKLDFTEDDLTQIIVDMMRVKGFDATSDTNTGGHVDLKIAYHGAAQQFHWLGEAKTDNGGVSNVFGGTEQILTRYATGEHGIQDHAGLIVYIRRERAEEFIAQLKDDVPRRVPVNTGLNGVEDCPLRPRMAFKTDYAIPRLGSTSSYKVRYMGVSLYFVPEDKSGRTSTVMQKKRQLLSE